MTQVLIPIFKEIEQGKYSLVTSDSRRVVSGAIFVAIRGTQVDGHDFLQASQKSGAALLVGEVPKPVGLQGNYLQVKDSKRTLGELLQSFHGDPSKNLKMVGITGTSGKTTTSMLVETILAEADLKPGLIGTVEMRWPGHRVVADQTTPGIEVITQNLQQMVGDGAKSLVMEVSSHALDQKRVAGLAWDVVAFLNLTPEHMDYHPTLEHYFQSKLLLFTDELRASLDRGKSPRVVLPLENSYGKQIQEIVLREFPQTQILDSSCGQLQVEHELGGQVIAGLEVPLRSRLVGAFNTQNLVAAFRMGQALGISNDLIASALQKVSVVPGRLEPVENKRGIHVLVDYAHKADALKKVLESLSALKGKRQLITVFGCGGNRDRTKRPVMGSVAVELSDQVVVTSDNPRQEDPVAIIEEILVGIPGGANHPKLVVEPDRRKAISLALGRAKAGDVVLIAGKGHEDYQILGKTKIHFDDREVVRELLSS